MNKPFQPTEIEKMEADLSPHQRQEVLNSVGGCRLMKGVFGAAILIVVGGYAGSQFTREVMESEVFQGNISLSAPAKTVASWLGAVGGVLLAAFGEKRIRRGIQDHALEVVRAHSGQ